MRHNCVASRSCCLLEIRGSMTKCSRMSAFKSSALQIQACVKVTNPQKDGGVEERCEPLHVQLGPRLRVPTVCNVGTPCCKPRAAAKELAAWDAECNDRERGRVQARNRGQAWIYLSGAAETQDGLPLLPDCMQSTPNRGLVSLTCLDLMDARVSIGLRPEFSASAIGTESSASAKARMAYCSRPGLCFRGQLQHQFHVERKSYLDSRVFNSQ